MNWTANSEAVERRMWLAAAIGIPLILLLAFFLVTRLSIGSLVRGLAGPISEIGRSTQNFAANAMTLAAGKTDNAARASASSAPLQVQDSNYEARKVIKELIAENKELFSNPSGDLIEFFEREGEKSPAAVGALLCEFDRDVLKNIFQFGYGDWWFNAFSAPSQSPSEALEILSRVNSLKIRQQFSQALRKPVSSEIKDLGLILNRLSYPELESLSKEYPMKKVTPLLALLPREKCVRVCKSAYPGEWGGLIGHSDWGVPDLSIAQQIQRKALALRPLRTEQSVENFFVTLEYQRYLDGAHTKDEKDIYKMLPENSPIKAKRVPFYEIFDSPPEVLKEIAVNAALSDWALAMKDCERYESIKIFDQLSERQRYFLRNMITAIKPHQVVLDEKIQAKKRIMALFLEKKAAHEFANKPPAETYSEAA